MNKTCVAATTWVHRAVHAALAATAGLMMCSAAYAVSFGHSRMVSGPGQPLGIDVSVVGLSPAESASLQVHAAPMGAWRQAGLMPPVDPATFRFKVVPGVLSDTRVIQIRSSEPFNGPVADVLLQVTTPVGQQQHQVSVLAHGGQVQPAAGQNTSAPAQSSNPHATGASTEQRRASIRVKHGDTLFAISRRHAVQGVTVYQMMVALQRANPKAFIHDNMNLVRAGATLHMPDRTALTAISDAEARRIFIRQAQAFAQYRQRLARQRAALAQTGSAEQGRVGSADAPSEFNSASATRDQLVLSMPGRGDAADDQQAATNKNIRESQQRVSQLEENVKSLNQALRSQGEAARSAVVEGVTSLGESLSEVADTLTPATPGSSSTSDDAAPAGAEGGNGVPNGASSGINGQTSPGSSTTGTGRGSLKGVGNAATVESQAAPSTPDAASGLNNGASGAGSASSGGSSGSQSVSPATTSQSPGGTTAAQPSQGTTSGQSTQGSASETDRESPSSQSNLSGQGSTSQQLAQGATASQSLNGSASPASSTSPGSSAPLPSSAARPGGEAGSGSSSSANQGATPQSDVASQESASRLAGSGGSSATSGNSSGGTAERSSAAAGISAGTASSSDAGSTARDASSSAQDSAAGGASDVNGSAAQTSGATRSAPPNSSNPVDSNQSEQSVSWFQEYSLVIITAALALIVLLIAWVLRRANSKRDDSAVTPAMVQEKLNTIDLDLDQPPSNSRPTRK